MDLKSLSSYSNCCTLLFRDSGFVKIIGDYLPKGSHGIINDLGIALSQTVPLNQYVSAGTLTIVGVITGLDGSGFSGISLAGSIANLFGTALGHGTATLTALGQIAAIYRRRDFNSLGAYSCRCHL